MRLRKRKYIGVGSAIWGWCKLIRSNDIENFFKQLTRSKQ